MGIFFTFIGIMYVALGWTFNSNNAETGYVLIALAFILFVNVFLFPQFHQNDERAKTIRQKAFFYSYFFSVGYILIFGGLAAGNVLSLTTYETLTTLSAIMIVTPALLMVILAKRM